MRLTSYEASLQMKKKVDRSITLFYSSIVAIVLFLFSLGGGFGVALLVAALTFVFLFAIVYGILSLQTNAVYRKLRNIQVDGTYLEVSFRNEQGILVFTPHKLVYHAMIKGATNKIVELEINEDLFMAYGEFKQSKRRDLMYGGYHRCHITLRPMPHGIVRQFRFFDVDGALEKVGALLEEISQFRPEKYQ